MIELLLISCCPIVLILLIWFNSDFAYYWGRLLKLSKLMRLYEYENAKLSQLDYPLSYPTFLKMKSDNFFIHLITCRICLCVWLSIIASLVFTSIIWAPVVCIVSLILYGTTVRLLQLP